MSLQIDPPVTAPLLRALPAQDRERAVSILENCLADTLAHVTTVYGSGTTPITSWGGTAEANIRPPASIAYGLAVAVTAGLGGETERAQAVRLLTSVAATHKANSPTGWGGVPIAGTITPDDKTPAWQGAMWVAYAAIAGRLLWAHLTEAQRGQVDAMVKLEADRFLTYRAPSYRNRSGAIVTAGDSKTEENGWNSWVLFLAAAALPGDANASTWKEKGIELVLSAAASPGSVDSRRVINGYTLGAVLTGSNLEMDGYQVNHGLRSPHYTSSVRQCWIAGLVYAWLSGEAAPAACFHNGDLAYWGVSDAKIGSSSAYTPGTYAIYYPDGAEGDPDRMNGFAQFDACAHIAGRDVLATTPAIVWFRLHADRQIALQATDGSRRGWFDLQTAADAVLSDWIVQEHGPVVSNR
ncbi:MULTISPECIES: hypothetical protein [unclassified Microbacterium]|uniref:hypothetical protein n=1 Tax=unclassified Microbacterium TaxID=2609290 RepID=UPI00386C6E37